MGERKTLAIAALGESFSIGWVQGWTECLMKLPKYLNLTIQHDYATVVCFSRARIAEDMLKTPWDYILLVDDDNPPEPGRILQLVMDLELNPHIDLVAGWYSLDMGGSTELSFGRAFKVLRSTFQRRYPANPSDLLNPEAPDLQEIDWTGLGCVVMRRPVLEKCGPQAFLPFQEGPEEHQRGPNRGWIWDDMHFCKTARAQGFRLFVDRRVRVPHLKLRDITMPWPEATDPIAMDGGEFRQENRRLLDQNDDLAERLFRANNALIDNGLPPALPAEREPANASMGTGHKCLVCGFGMGDPPQDFNICPCCGTEFGYMDVAPDRAARLSELRQFWIAGGMKWWNEYSPAPLDWNPAEQLKTVPLVPANETPAPVAASPEAK